MSSDKILSQKASTAKSDPSQTCEDIIAKVNAAADQFTKGIQQVLEDDGDLVSRSNSSFLQKYAPTTGVSSGPSGLSPSPTDGDRKHDVVPSPLTAAPGTRVTNTHPDSTRSRSHSGLHFPPSSLSNATPVLSNRVSGSLPFGRSLKRAASPSGSLLQLQQTPLQPPLVGSSLPGLHSQSWGRVSGNFVDPYSQIQPSLPRDFSLPLPPQSISGFSTNSAIDIRPLKQAKTYDAAGIAEIERVTSQISALLAEAARTGAHIKQPTAALKACQSLVNKDRLHLPPVPGSASSSFHFPALGAAGTASGNCSFNFPAFNNGKPLGVPNSSSNASIPSSFTVAPGLAAAAAALIRVNTRENAKLGLPGADFFGNYEPTPASVPPPAPAPPKSRGLVPSNFILHIPGPNCPRSSSPKTITAVGPNGKVNTFQMRPYDPSAATFYDMCSPRSTDTGDDGAPSNGNKAVEKRDTVAAAQGTSNYKDGGSVPVRDDSNPASALPHRNDATEFNAAAQSPGAGMGRGMATRSHVTGNSNGGRGRSRYRNGEGEYDADNDSGVDESAAGGVGGEQQYSPRANGRSRAAAGRHAQHGHGHGQTRRGDTDDYTLGYQNSGAWQDSGRNNGHGQGHYGGSNGRTGPSHSLPYAHSHIPPTYSPPYNHNGYGHDHGHAHTQGGPASQNGGYREDTYARHAPGPNYYGSAPGQQNGPRSNGHGHGYGPSHSYNGRGNGDEYHGQDNGYSQQGGYYPPGAHNNGYGSSSNNRGMYDDHIDSPPAPGGFNHPRAAYCPNVGQQGGRETGNVAGMDDEDEDDETDLRATDVTRRRSKLPLQAVLGLRRWFKASLAMPYPNARQKNEMAEKLNLSFRQVHNWFSNTRKRLYAPWLKSMGIILMPFRSLSEHDVKVMKAAVDQVSEEAYMGPL